MNKKVIDEIENKEQTASLNTILIVILIILFGVTLYITCRYIVEYQKNSELKVNQEVIKINTDQITASIINKGKIDEEITLQSYNENGEMVIEKINEIEIIAANETESKIEFDINYNILVNDFKVSAKPTNKSEVLVRFAYSFDGEEWTYINNVISTNTSNLSPLIGNNYDISGLITNLKVATNYELKPKDLNPLKMYWKSETLFKKIEEKENSKKFQANFTIDYDTNN